MKRIIVLIAIFILYSNINSQEYLDNTAIVRFKELNIFGDEIYEEILAPYDAHIVRRFLPLKASFILKRLNNQLPSAYDEKVEKIIKAEEPLLRTFVVRFDSDMDAMYFSKYLQKHCKEVEIVEPYFLHELQIYEPNDPLIFAQEDMLEQIKALEAWEIYKGDENITIGISDNGVQQSHEDLRNNIAINTGEIQQNGIDDDNNGYIDDYNGFNLDGRIEGENWWNTYSSDNHGMLVAGIATAEFDNNTGIAGIGGKSKFFPIRIGSSQLAGNYTAYGYESIIYAATRGFKVLNCSWGSSSNEYALEQSAVDYAIARDVAIVAASGNLSGGEDRVTKFFPPGYKGILGVGEVTSFDNLTPNSSLGTHCDIMAPGQGNYSTDIDNGVGSPYITVGGGTSFASPVVAGAVALARGKYPQLSAIQSIEFVRQCTDDISQDLTFFKDVIPGRLNLLKVVTTDPMSIPGIIIDSVNYFDENGDEKERFFEGEIVDIRLNIGNVLGNASQLDFKLTRVYPDPEFSDAITIIDSLIEDIDILSNENKTLVGFKYQINTNNIGRTIFRLDITNNMGYSDFILFDNYPVPSVTTFENDEIKFSIGDKGNFGFGEGSPSNLLEGVGFIDKSYGDDLYESGIFVTQNDESVIASFTKNTSDFTSIKPYYNPINTGIIATNDINFKVKIEQTIELPKSKPWVRIRIDLQDSSALGSQYGIGYEFDWDIGLEDEYDYNYTQFLEASRPESIPYEKYAAIFMGNKNFSQVFGAAIYSDEPDAIAQASGLRASDGLNSTKLINSLASGKSNITSDTADIFTLIGMRYTNFFEPFETKTCYLCVAGADNTTLLTNYLQDCATGILNSVEDDDKISDFKLIDNSIEISNINYKGAEIYSINGAKVYSTQDNIIELNSLKQGVYFIKVDLKDKYTIKKISIIR